MELLQCFVFALCILYVAGSIGYVLNLSAIQLWFDTNDILLFVGPQLESFAVQTSVCVHRECNPKEDNTNHAQFITSLTS